MTNWTIKNNWHFPHKRVSRSTEVFVSNYIYTILLLIKSRGNFENPKSCLQIELKEKFLHQIRIPIFLPRCIRWNKSLMKKVSLRTAEFSATSAFEVHCWSMGEKSLNLLLISIIGRYRAINQLQICYWFMIIFQKRKNLKTFYFASDLNTKRLSQTNVILLKLSTMRMQQS